jgi:uncharacterized LabA/DUF88 family protein
VRVDTDAGSSVRIAVLIDADNTSPKYAEALLEELAKYGTPTIKRAYGDFSSQRLSGWTRELNARAIRAIHQNAFTTGKNSTDSALIIDAMDLLYAGNVGAFALVSSDSDFTGLALRLREAGKTVYGLGRKRTPQSLQNACDRFIPLEVLGEEPAEDADETAGDPADATDDSDDSPRINLQSALTKAVNATADDEGWTTVSAIGNHLSRTHASFDPRSFGHAKLSTLVAAQGYLDTEVEGRQTMVRLKSRKPAKKAPAKTPAKTPAKSTAKTPAKKSTTKTSAKTSAKTDAPQQGAAKKAAAEETAGQSAGDKKTDDEPGAPRVTVTTRTRRARPTSGG